MLKGNDIGIDLGTTELRIFVRGRGVVLREPSVIAVERESGRVLKVGLEAEKMLGRTPANLAALHPLQNGVISDFEMAERLLRELLRKISGFRLLKPRVLITVPSGITGVEERAVVEAGLQAGARRVYLLEAPVAAALGAGLNIGEPGGKMVVHIGGGVTDVAVLSLSGMVESASIRQAGEQFNDALIRYVRQKQQILIGRQTAEELKRQIGCMTTDTAWRSADVRGRCLLTGLPKLGTLYTEELPEAFHECGEAILDAIRAVLERTAPELVADIAAGGITLTGGGSQLRGLDRLIEERTGIPARPAENCADCAVAGLGQKLEQLDELPDGVLHLARRRLL